MDSYICSSALAYGDTRIIWYILGKFKKWKNYTAITRSLNDLVRIAWTFAKWVSSKKQEKRWTVF